MLREGAIFISRHDHGIAEEVSRLQIQMGSEMMVLIAPL
jgi:hypothetical protein